MWFSVKLLGEGSVRLSIVGQLDGATLSDLEPMLARLSARQPWQLELDLSRLRMIDSIGVGGLVRFWKRLRACGSFVTVTGLRDQPLAVFRLLRLEQGLEALEVEARCN